MKNERGSDFFPSTKINGWKQRKKIANYVLPSAARAFCSGSAGSASCIRHARCSQAGNLFAILFPLRSRISSEGQRRWGTVPYSGRVSDENCFWIWLWSLENCSNDFLIRLFLLSLSVTSIRYSCRPTGKSHKMEIKLIIDPKTCF